MHRHPPASPDPLTRRAFVARAAALGAGLLWLPESLAAERQGWAGAARVRRVAAELRLGNDAVAVSWDASGGSLRALRMEDGLGGRALALPPDVFVLRLADGRSIRSSEMRLVGSPREETLAGEPRASRLAERLGGRRIVAELEDAGSGLRASWRGVLRDGGSYVRQEVELRPTGGDVPVREIVLLDLDVPGARVAGSVRGSPVVAGNLFLGFEHPLSETAVAGTRAYASLPRELPLRAGTSFAVSSVLGTTPPGQLRRGFLGYVERERAHPYRTFLHYNSWYDIGYFSKYDEAAALDVIHAFGQELNRKRGVTLDSFLFDDGWDDPRRCGTSTAASRTASPHPRRGRAVRRRARRVALAVGRLRQAEAGPAGVRRAQGFETNEGGFALSGPKYYSASSTPAWR